MLFCAAIPWEGVDSAPQRELSALHLWKKNYWGGDLNMRFKTGEAVPKDPNTSFEKLKGGCNTRLCKPFWPQEDYRIQYNHSSALLGDLASGGEVYLLGDSVIGQLCQLGNPGLCCSAANHVHAPCPTFGGANPFVNIANSLGVHPPNHTTWQHFDQFWARATRSETSHVPVWALAPLANTYSDPFAAVSGVAEFMINRRSNTKSSGKHDVLIVGLLGNHFETTNQGPSDRFSAGLDHFNAYAEEIMKRIVATFPGCVVVIGYSPQHFAGTGGWSGRGTYCAPAPTPESCGEGACTLPQVRESIWGYHYNKYAQTLKHSTYLDVYPFLHSLWGCHRDSNLNPNGIGPLHFDCTHWNDGIYSILSEMVLESLERLPRPILS